MPRVKQRTPLLRNHILEVAIALLSREGPAGFTTRGIARQASTSTPAVYELFGDRRGLLRDVYFEGFQRLRRHLEAPVDAEDPRANLVQLARRYREFLVQNPVLSEVMFSRPFTDFDPGPSEAEASSSVRIFIVERVRRCVAAGNLTGDETDVAHVLVSLVQGLATAENARRLGTTRESINRRWTLAIEATLDGLSP